MELCYLDRRYFNLVLQARGLKTVLENPMHLLVDNMDIQWKSSSISPSRISYGCLVIHTSDFNHSTLFLLDPLTSTCYWWDPFFDDAQMVGLHNKVLTVIQNYFRSLGFHRFCEITQTVPNVNVNICQRSGFCNAYILKYALALHENRNFNSSGIVQFANGIEKQYRHSLPLGKPEIDFGPGNGSAPLMGGLGGALVGGAIGGPTGALLGGVTGAAVGGMVASHSRSEAQYQ